MYKTASLTPDRLGCVGTSSSWERQARQQPAFVQSRTKTERGAMKEIAYALYEHPCQPLSVKEESCPQRSTKGRVTH